MRYGILSDVHGNLEALEAVLAHLKAQAVDSYAFLGDAVGYGANPNEACELLRPLVSLAVVGNHAGGDWLLVADNLSDDVVLIDHGKKLAQGTVDELLKRFEGKVTKISPMGVEKDNVTTFEVKVSIQNSTGELKANMTANAEILLDEHKGVLTVPENAVIYDNQKNASVEVPDKSQKTGTRKISVKVGLSNGSVTEILSGLKEGEQVVLQQ